MTLQTGKSSSQPRVMVANRKIQSATMTLGCELDWPVRNQELWLQTGFSCWQPRVMDVIWEFFLTHIIRYSKLKFKFWRLTFLTVSQSWPVCAKLLASSPCFRRVAWKPEILVWIQYVLWKTPRPHQWPLAANWISQPCSQDNSARSETTLPIQAAHSETTLPVVRQLCPYEQPIVIWVKQCQMVLYSTIQYHMGQKLGHWGHLVIGVNCTNWVTISDPFDTIDPKQCQMGQK